MNVLFDLDGTLTDPRPGITGSIAHALECLGRAVPPEADLLRFIGPPLTDAFRMLLASDDGELVAKAVRHYRERFSSQGVYENEVYPGIVSALSELQRHNLVLFIATSKPRVFANRIADHFDLSLYFRAIYGSELDGTNSDKRTLIRHILATEKLDPAQTVMIGDREHDIHGAVANGLRSIGVLWGYGSRLELERAKATVVCTAPKNLMSTLSSKTFLLDPLVRQ